MARETFPDEMLEDPTGRKAEQAYARNMLILQREGRMKVNWMTAPPPADRTAACRAPKTCPTSRR